MDNVVLSVFNKEVTITKRITLRVFDLLFLAGITLAGVLVRLVLFDIVSGDYLDFLQHWYNELAAVPGFGALGQSVGNYNVPYLYLMKLMTVLPMRDLHAIKLVSGVFDLFAAAVMGGIVWRQTGNKTYALGAYAVTLLAPTVVLNGAAWAQCDIIYSLFLLLCVGAFLKERPLSAAVWFGVAFSFKLQAVFLLPLLVWMWIAKRIKIRHLLAIPAVYFILLIPAWIAGRPLGELLRIYADQTSAYETRLSMNYPNLYTFISGQYVEEFSTAGILMTVCVVGLMVYFMYSTAAHPTPNLIVTFALLSAMTIPFFLPFMHDRYGFVADVLVILYLFMRPARWPAAIGFTLISLCAYAPFLFGAEPIQLELVAVGYVFCIGYVAADLARQCVSQRSAETRGA